MQETTPRCRRFAVGLKDYDFFRELEADEGLEQARESAQEYARDLAGALASTEEDTTIEWYVQGTDKSEEEIDDGACACWRTVETGSWTTPRVRDD